MNWLQPNFYISFPVIPASYQVALLDLMAYARLAKNVEFIETAEELRKNYGPGEELNYLFETVRKLSKRQTKPDGLDLKRLSRLHLNAYVEPSSIKKNPSPLPLCLLTEKFFWHYPTINLGSARHGLLLDYQIKGIGRNPLATRNDHNHSWGGLHLWQGLKAYVLGHLLKGITPQGVLNTTMVSVRDSEFNAPIRPSSVCLALREADATRVTQVTTKFDPNMLITQQKIQSRLLKKMAVKTPRQQLDKIIFNYAVLYLLGVYHLAVTRENVTIEGKLIDYEDVLFNFDGEEILLRYELQVCQKKQAPFVWYKGERLFTSSLHLYLDAIELSLVGLEHLFNWKFDRSRIKPLFLKMLNKLSDEIFDVDPEFMKISKIFLEEEALYQRGEISNRKSFPATRINKKIGSKSLTVLREQDQVIHRHISYGVKVKRPKLKTACPVKLPHHLNSEDIVQKILSRLQLESSKGKITEESLLFASSEANELIMSKMFIFPYQWDEGKIKLKAYSQKVLHRQLTEELAPYDMKILAFKEDPAKGKYKILKGLVVSWKGQSHTLLIGPFLVK